ncbi:MAG TPA: phosphoserine phosphatase SerB, partial [Sporichthya sp.]|nr:phosphoserine phosphatase SerB [Sporichthya sp.]
MATDRTLLVTITGRDRPGVTAALFDALTGSAGVTGGVEVLDVEQVVIRGRLVLGVLLAPGTEEAGLRAAVAAAAHGLGMDVEIASGTGDNLPRREGRLHVTVLGHPLRTAAMAGVAARIADCGANIDRIMRLSRQPVTSLELDVSGAGHTPADTEALRIALAAEASARGVDIAVHPAGLHRRGKRLVVMDVDSTLIQGEVIELLAAHAGCEPEVARITEAAMRGELDFEQSLRARVALLAGLDAGAIDEVRAAVRLTPGARTLIRTLKRLDHEVAIVSGGFTQITDGLVEELGLDYSAANTLEIVDGKLTGNVVGPVVDRAFKARALEQFASLAGVPLAQTVAIGDGANDLDMLAKAGLGVAFNAKPLVRRQAQAAINVPYLDA